MFDRDCQLFIGIFADCQLRFQLCLLGIVSFLSAIVVGLFPETGNDFDIWSFKMCVYLKDFDILQKFGRFGGLGIEKMRQNAANCQNPLDKRRFLMNDKKSAFI